MEEVERALIESTRKLRHLMRVRRKNPKNIWWNDGVKVAVERKEAAWKEVNEDRCMGITKKKSESKCTV